MSDPSKGIEQVSRRGESIEPCQGTGDYLRVLVQVGEWNQDAEKTVAKCVGRIQDSFRHLNWQHDIVVIVPKNDLIQASKSLSGKVDRVCSDLPREVFAEAAMCPKVTHLAWVDATCGFSELQWSLLSESSRDVDIASCYSRPPRNGRWISQLGELIATTVSRLLLRTGKNSRRPGVVLISKSFVETISSDQIEFESGEELISLAKFDGKSVAEVAIEDSSCDAIQRATFWNAVSSVGSNARFVWNNLAFPTIDFSREVNPQKTNSWLFRALSIFVLFAISSTLLFTSLGYPLFEPDEARNAQIGYNIYHSGDWMSLTLFGEPYWDKPPLQAWLTATSYTLFGPSQFATRLPCAIASLMTVLTVLFLGSKLFGFRTGMTGAVLLALCGGFSIIGRYVTMDATLTCLATIMLTATILGVRHGKINLVWMIVAGIACGLGLLTKGPIIMVLVLPPILVAGWLERKSFFRNPRFWLYAGIPAFCIAAPWFVATAIVHPDFLVYFFWKHNVVRFSSGFNHEHPWWFYIPVIFLMMYPASNLLPQFMKQMWTQTRAEKRRELGAEFGVLFLYVAWIIGFFTCSSSKLPTYILPAIPVLCLLIARVLETRIFAADANEKALHFQRVFPKRTAWFVWTGIVFVVGILSFGPSPVEPAMVVFLILGLVALTLLCIYGSRRKASVTRSWGTAGVVSACLLVLIVGYVLPRFSESRSVHVAINEIAEDKRLSDAPVVFIGRPPYGHPILLPGKRVTHFGDDHKISEIAEYIKSHDKTIVVSSSDVVDALRLKGINHTVAIRDEEHHRKLYTTHVKRSRLRQANRKQPQKIRTANSRKPTARQAQRK